MGDGAYRIEIRLRESWDQPIVVTHPEEKFAARVADALYREFGRPVRVTSGNNPDPDQWGSGACLYSRGC